MVAPTQQTILGVLLAGGQSRRMGGGDKCLTDIAGRPMLCLVCDRFAPQVASTLINANGDPARFADFDLPVAADTIGGFNGPLAGVLTGMEWARENAPELQWIATAATDAPFLPLDLVERLTSAIGETPDRIALCASFGRQHPVFGLWPVALADDLRTGLEAGTRKVLDWTDRHDTVTVEFVSVLIGDTEIDPFFNTNRPEELAKASDILQQVSP